MMKASVETVESTNGDAVRKRFNDALSLKDSVVLALTQAAESLSGSLRRELTRLSNEVAFASNAEGVLRNPRLLELFLPLAIALPKLLSSDPRTRQSEVDRHVFQVLQRQTKSVHATKGRWDVLLYPLLVLLMSLLVLAFIAVAIVPEFEQMFFEFGLTLPAPTKLVITLSHLFESVWFWLFFGLLVLLVGAIMGLRAAFQLRWLLWESYGSQITGRHSTRRSLGDFAWHTAMLLEAGQEIDTAIEIAGAAKGQVDWRFETPNLTNPLLGNPQQPTQMNWYHGTPCHLLSLALNLHQEAAASGAQAALLREVACVYWDREQSQMIWMLSWLHPVAVLGTSFVVGFVVLALFMPLVQLISGLT